MAVCQVWTEKAQHQHGNVIRLFGPLGKVRQLGRHSVDDADAILLPKFLQTVTGPVVAK